MWFKELLCTILLFSLKYELSNILYDLTEVWLNLLNICRSISTKKINIKSILELLTPHGHLTEVNVNSLNPGHKEAPWKSLLPKITK